MLAVVHMLAGAALGILIGNWAIALFCSIGLHLLFDMLPHVDPGTLKKPEERGSMNLTDLVLVFLDLSIGLGLFVLLFQYGKLSSSVFAGVAGGVLPDLPSGFYHAVPILKQHPIFGWYYRFNRRIQGTVDKKDWLRGVAPEIIIVTASITVLFL